MATPHHSAAHGDGGLADWPEIKLRPNTWRLFAEHDPAIACTEDAKPSLQAIGRRIGIHRSTLWEIDCGTRALSATVIVRMAVVHGENTGVQWTEAAGELFHVPERRTSRAHGVRREPVAA